MTLPDRLSLDQEVSLFLATCRTACLATVGPDGAAYAANVQYVQDEDFRLVWVSSPTAEHSKHLTLEPRVAVTVYAHDDRATEIHGLQMRGLAEAIEVAPSPGAEPLPESGSEPDRGEAWRSAFDRYVAKFSFVASNPRLRAAVEKQTFYVFRPTWIRWIDNRVRFGHKVEWSL